METTDSLESLTLFIDFYGNDRETEVAKKSASFWNSEQQKISSFTISNYKEMWIYWRNVLEVPFEYSFEQEQLNIFNSSSWMSVTIEAVQKRTGGIGENDFEVGRVAIRGESSPVPIPESASMLLLGLGMLVFTGVGRKKLQQ